MDREKVDRLLPTALWWKQIRETNNETFLPLFFDQHRYLVLKGGGGSGKSIFAGRKVLERVTSEPGHRWLVCRKVARTLRESCFEQLRGQIADFYPNAGARVNKSDMNITFANGSKILFAGLDDVEKLKSIYDITGIWIEEASELEEGDFNQLDIRLRTIFPYYLQILITFNPIRITHWLKKRFFDKPDPRARLHESTYKDNRFLTEEAIKTLEAFKDTDEYYYMVYCLGQWGVTGKTVFNAKAVAERLERIRPPAAEGLFEYDIAEDGVHIRNIRWIEEKDGPIKVYKPPQEGRPYVIGGDTAGDGSDWFVGQVLDNVTGVQAAVLRHEYDEDTYARQMYCLGRWYNNAMLAPGDQLFHIPGETAGSHGLPEPVRPGDRGHLRWHHQARLRVPDGPADAAGDRVGTDPGTAGQHRHRERQGHAAGNADLREKREAAPGGGTGGT